MISTPPMAMRRSRGSLTGIAFKVASVLVFLVMSSFIKAANGVPAGELVFFRSFFGMLPVSVFIAWQGALRESLKSHAVGSQIWRGRCVRSPTKDATLFIGELLRKRSSRPRSVVAACWLWTISRRILRPGRRRSASTIVATRCMSVHLTARV